MLFENDRGLLVIYFRPTTCEGPNIVVDFDQTRYGRPILNLIKKP